jgi:hypothetical protein
MEVLSVCTTLLPHLGGCRGTKVDADAEADVPESKSILILTIRAIMHQGAAWSDL